MLAEKKKVIESNHKEIMTKLVSLDYVVRTTSPSSTDKISRGSKQSDKREEAKNKK